MTIHVSRALMCFGFVAGFGSSALAALPDRSDGFQRIQYDRYPDQRRDGYNNNPNQPRDGYNNYPGQSYQGQNFQGQNRDGYGGAEYRGPKWRAGQVVPGPLLNQVVFDWEERGLSRPPNDHQWMRVGLQFLLVRGKDRMIARILNFD